MSEEFGLKGGWSVDDWCTDSITGRTYDLRIRKNLNEVRKMIKRDRPLVLTASPPCTLFSIANRGPIDPREMAGAVEMIKVSMEMCEFQRREGRYFVFEQPQGSRAWDLEVVKKMVTKQEVDISTMHQCMYGLKSTDVLGEAPAYKPTRLMTNHEALTEALSRRCVGGHRHVHLVGKATCMKEDPELKQKLSEVEDKQNRWIGRRIESHDASAASTQEVELSKGGASRRGGEGVRGPTAMNSPLASTSVSKHENARRV